MKVKSFTKASDWDLEIITKRRIGRLPHWTTLTRADHPPRIIALNLTWYSDQEIKQQVAEVASTSLFAHVDRRSLRLISPAKHQREVFEEALSSRDPVPLGGLLVKGVDTLLTRGALDTLNAVPLVILPEDVTISTETLNHPLAVKIEGVAFTNICNGLRLATAIFSNRRLWNYASHEGGHVLGRWRHCRNPKCIMQKNCAQGRDFCKYCLEKLEQTYRWLRT